MPSSNVAIIDLGSNTFHLLICQVSKGSFTEVYRKRLFIGLAEGGIELINDQALYRAREGFSDFRQILLEYDISKTKIIGTAALRSASNASLVNHMAEEILGQPIEIIAGEREAELIYKGVSLITDTSINHHLIMDIGGGSTEFILISNGKRTWSQSFNIGVAVLHELFHKSEPIANEDIGRMEQFLDHTLQPLHKTVSGKDVTNLIGASGSFEVVVTMNDGKLSSNTVHSYDPKDFELFEEKVISATYEDRALLKGMPQSRVKLIVVAFILMRYVLRLTKPKQILVSPYALKEGVIVEMM